MHIQRAEPVHLDVARELRQFRVISASCTRHSYPCVQRADEAPYVSKWDTVVQPASSQLVREHGERKLLDEGGLWHRLERKFGMASPLSLVGVVVSACAVWRGLECGIVALTQH